MTLQHHSVPHFIPVTKRQQSSSAYSRHFRASALDGRRRPPLRPPVPFIQSYVRYSRSSQCFIIQEFCESALWWRYVGPVHNTRDFRVLNFQSFFQKTKQSRRGEFNMVNKTPNKSPSIPPFISFWIPANEITSNDLHLLAINAQLTEVSFSIADIQTRIFGSLYHHICFAVFVTDRSCCQKFKNCGIRACPLRMETLYRPILQDNPLPSLQV